MKRITYLATVLALTALPASAEIIGVEPFNYSNGNIANQNGGTYWDYKNTPPIGHGGAASDWDNVTGIPTVTSGKLSTLNTSAKREYNGSGEGLPPSDEANGAVNESNVAKKIYYRVTARTGATVPDFFGLSSYDFGAERLFFGKLFGDNFGVQESGVGGTPSGTAVTVNTTYTLVARIDFVENDIRLYVNPDLNAAESTQTPTVTRAYTGANWSTALRLASGGGNAVTWDDLVVATTWEDLGTLVTTTADSGAGSLREAVAKAALLPGPDTITFGAPLVAGSVVGLTADLTIPAAGDAAGVTIHTDISGGAVDVVVNAGTLTFSGGSAWTGGGKVLLGATTGSAPATVDLTGPDGFNFRAPITVRAGSSGVKTLRGSNPTGACTYSGAITLLAPATVDRPDGDNLDFTGNVNLGPHLLTVNADDDVIFYGRLYRDDPGTAPAQVVKNGFSYLYLRGSGDNTRLAVTVNKGNLYLYKASSVHALGGGLPTGTTALTVASAATVYCNGGDQIADTASVTLNGYLNLNGSETLNALNGSGSVQELGGIPLTLTLGAGHGSGSFSGSLYDSGGNALSLTKTGTGTQTVAGGSMSGAVLVSGGTLNVTGSLGNSSGTTVQSGATLAGMGTVKNLTLESGSFFAPGDATTAGSIATLNVSGSTTWNGGATARCHLSGTDNTSDKLAVTGALTKGTSGTFHFDFQGTGTAGQTYTLATFASSGFTAADFTYTGLSPGLTGTFTKNATSFTFTTAAFSPVVTSAADTGPGSLRQILIDAAANPGPDTLTFAPALSGGTLTLTGPNNGTAIAINDADGVTLDATGLPGGLTINDGSATDFRLFSVASGSSLTLRGLTLAKGGGSAFGGPGGAIYNDGTLTLTHCTLSGNSAGGGGGGGGGAIYNSSTLTLTHCTLSGNSAGNDGGAIFNSGMLTLTHCTLSGNSANSGSGGAINNNGPLTLTNSIVAGNTATEVGADIYHTVIGNRTRVGANIIQSVFAEPGGTDSGPAALTAAPLLAPLANYGGPTQTMALLPGSPALDAATVLDPALPTDQRGLPRHRDGNTTAGALPDIGAYEAQVALVGSLGFNFNAASPRDLAPTDSAGAPGYTQTHWNNLTGDFGTADTARPLSGGGTATVRTWYDSPNPYTITPTAPTTPDQKLMFGYLDSASVVNSGTDLYQDKNQPFFALADLPPAFTLGGYKVVVYADTDSTDGRVGEYWLTTLSADPSNVSGTTDLSPHLFLADSANFTNTYTRVPATSTARATAAAGNFLVLENQTQPAFILRTEDHPSFRAVLNAVQIVRNELLVVTTAADELDPVGTPGTGLSLREAVALAPDGAGIIFDSALSGQTITLGSEIILGQSVIVDASSLPGGLTIQRAPGDSNKFRLFSVASNTSFSLRGLNLANGGGSGFSGNGGAIINGGTLTLTQCTLSGNSASSGGAIYNDGGTVRLTHCTVAGNSASSATAIRNQGATAIMELTHCTVSGHSGGFGVAAIGFTHALTLTLRNSIVAGNIPFNLSAGTYSEINSLTSGDPLLAPLGNYGGPTQTMSLLPGSPARNAATGSLATTDQRGFPIVGTADIGAYEAGTYANYHAWIWESLPTAGNGTITDPLHATTFDYDSDGQSNGDEWLSLTHPASGASFFLATPTRSGNNLVIAFSTALGRTYTLQRSDDLATGTWTTTGLPAALPGTGAPRQLTVPATTPDRRFYRVLVSE